MRKLRLALFCCGLLLGCNLPTVSPPPTETTEIPVLTPTEIPLTPSVTPIPALSKDGPWLIYEIAEPTDSSQYRIMVTNLDGSGIHQLELPPIYEPVKYSPANAVAESLAALRITSPHRRLIDQVLSTSIWVVSLPGGEVIKKIPLIGEQAELWIAARPPSELQGLTTTILGAPFFWSPDGRFLAFSGALDGESTDVYIYDIFEDQITQLTDGSKQAVIHSWSPDSRWIIHEASLFFDPHARVIYSAWAASVEGEVVRLEYGPFNNHPVIGWLTTDTFLTYTKREHGSSYELRSVNIQSGSTEFIYDQPFYEAAFNPESSEIVLNLQPLDYASASSLSGIYILDQNSRELDLVMPGTFSALAWQIPSGKFSAAQTNNKLVLFDVEGNIPVTLPYALKDQVSYSPNQHWMLVTNQQHSSLYTLWGELVLEIDQPGEVFWLPDSSGIIFCSQSRNHTSSIIQYLLEKEWETETMQEGISLPGCPILIAP